MYVCMYVYMYVCVYVQFLTLHRPAKSAQHSFVQELVSHTRNTADTPPANTRHPSGDHDTRATPFARPRCTCVATPMGTFQTTSLGSRGEAEMSRFPQGLQERLVTGLWPGELSTRTHDVTNLCHDNITHYLNIHYQLHNCAWNLNIVVVLFRWTFFR